MRTLVGAAAAVLLLAGAPYALAHEGSQNMRSEVTAITPQTKGVTVEVLNYDDRLELRNTSGEPVVIEGYRGEPYARVLADGTVEVNTSSEAYYLNDDRYGDGKVPADLPSTPRWKELSRSGRFEWHDHRMHWMSKGTPPQVKDEDARAHVFDWKVPISVGGSKGAIAGTLDWVPLPGGGLPTGLIWISALVLIALCVGVFVHGDRPLAQPRRPRRLEVLVLPRPMNTTQRSTRLRKSVLAATVAAVLAAPAAAQAHVTLNPREVTAGAFQVMTVRVPNERDDNGTVKVDVRFPDGFYTLSYKKVQGWKVRIFREKLDRPVEREGLKITEQISRVVWTGNRRKGGIIKPDQFEEFPISVQVPEGEAGSFLTFRAFQTYRGGERVAWTGAPDADTPAPRVKLLAPADGR